MAIIIRPLGHADRHILERVADGVFDNGIEEPWATEFLNDPRHHLLVALEGNLVVGMATGVHYIHPDKAPELWINEVGVAPSHEGAGIGSRLVEALLDVGRKFGCGEAWVLTDRTNTRAIRLYAGRGGKATDQVMFTFYLNRTGGE